MLVRVYMIKLMDDKICLDGKRKIACGASCLLIRTIRNFKDYYNKQPEIILQLKHECFAMFWKYDIFALCLFLYLILSTE